MLRAGVLAIMLASLALPGVALAVPPLRIVPDQFDARVGENGVASSPSAAKVLVPEPVASDTDVIVTSNNPALAIQGGKVTIPAGQTQGTIVYSASSTASDVTLEATLGADHATAHVQVLGAADPTPKMAVLPFDGPVHKVGSSAFLTAVFDPSTPTPAHMLWTVAGANSQSTVHVAGSPLFSYTGAHAGTDTITSCYSTDDSNCANSKQVTVTWATPSASASPAVLSFGSLTAGGTSAAQPVTLTNDGSVTVDVGSASLIGAGAGQFKTSADGCSGTTLDVGAACTISVAFAPTRPGSFAAQLRIPDDSTSSPHDIGLSGTGTEPPATTAAAPIGTPIAPVLPPSNAFTIVKVTGKRRTGELDLVVRSDAPGTFAVTATQKGKPHTLTRGRGRSSAGQPMTIHLKPSKSARKALRKKGKLRASLAVRFTPDGGVASSIKRPATFRFARKG